MDVRVPQQRLRESLLRVDLIHSFERQLNTVERRTYSVPNANSLWHVAMYACALKGGALNENYQQFNHLDS